MILIKENHVVLSPSFRRVERTAVAHTDLVVGSIMPTIIAQLQETADGFRKLGLIPPIVVRDVVWLPPGE